ncbi:DUF4190 domain-containing protein [Streptomyces sp. CdTB01]|uniref:DUF4190 domain-containing protein n=1 Tax=Streptomyces sp. CdTB01 TaxID=1725411 RepID=UPI00073A599D|nr:DUF4190 domain-containing protein [Streptomyces sp. CdTB01]ALV33792.1 hypothetical protein AS200_18400 [Streptomyces sp. CdTB01]
MSIPPPPGPHQPQEPRTPAQPPYPYPYQPWGQGYSPYNRPAPVNSLAIASLVLGILCCVPALGLLFGLIALGQIRRKGERGKGMAIAGSVLSSAGLALWVLVLATNGISSFWSGFKEAAHDHGSAYTLTEGECFDAPDGSLEGVAYDVDKVPCAGQHDGEVFAAFKMPGPAAYPGDEKVTDVADTRCYALRYSYAMDVWAVPDDVDVYYLTPTRESWRYGDREVTCVFGSTEDGGSLTGSLRNDERSLDADQIAYLKAVDTENKALDTQPVDDPDDDLRASTDWAVRMAGALAEESRLLRAHTWPADARGPVTAVAKEVETIREQWTRAAAATDADGFYTAYDRIMVLSAPGRSVTARKALGLATTPPSDGAGDGGRDGGGDASELEV